MHFRKLWYGFNESFRLSRIFTPVAVMTKENIRRKLYIFQSKKIPSLANFKLVVKFTM